MPSDSIAKFYEGANVFVTGATGFVGKVLVEKLLRSCTSIGSIYLLIRPKKGQSAEQRLEQLLNSPAFGRVRESDPECFKKVKILYGDVSQPKLGLSEAARKLAVDEINIVFHSAATVRFNDSLQFAVQMNTIGTKEVVELCNDMKNLKSFVYVSTAYSNMHKADVLEMFYEPIYNPKFVIDCINTLPPETLELITPTLIGPHPNTYTFSKSLAETIISEYASVMPIAIVRLGLVHTAWKEPYPGWTDTISAAIGSLVATNLGIVKTIVCNEEYLAELTPVDIVAKTLIAAAWVSATRRSKSIKIYNCAPGQINALKWKDFRTLLLKHARQQPTQLAISYPSVTFRTNLVMHAMCYYVFQVIPAYFQDLLLTLTKQQAKTVKMCKKSEDSSRASSFVLMNKLTFRASRFLGLIQTVKSAEDGEEFNIDLSQEGGFDWDEYVKAFVLGTRLFILKEHPSTLSTARARLSRLYWATKTIQIVVLSAFVSSTLWWWNGSFLSW